MPTERTRLRAELVAVGTELLLGDSVDTNSAWLAARLAEIGVDVYRHTTVGDNIGRMVSVIGAAAGRADAVLVTGGLGPTQDDLTRSAVARLTGVELARDPALERYIRDYFARGGRPMPDSNLSQADLPEGARVLAPVGTAAGFAARVVNATVYCMPGVPQEMRQMAHREVLPELRARGGSSTTVSRLVRTAGMSESAVAEACDGLVDRLEAAGNPTVAFLASRGETRVRVTGSAPDRAAALALVDPVVAELIELLGTNVAGLDDEGTEHAVARQLHRAGWSLAVAESITGGGLGARLVSVAGASEWFKGGLITYATETKVSLGGMEEAVLERHGPVSEATAEALAEGARRRVGADVGLAVVGVAGPTAQGKQPVGTVCVAATVPGLGTRARTVTLPGRGRTTLQEFAVSIALDFLRRILAEATPALAEREASSSG